MQDKYGNTPLHIAVYSNDIEMCKLLINYKANPKIKNNDSLNPVDLCFTEKDKSLLNYFRSISTLNDMFRPEDA